MHYKGLPSLLHSLHSNSFQQHPLHCQLLQQPALQQLIHWTRQSMELGLGSWHCMFSFWMPPHPNANSRCDHKRIQFLRTSLPASKLGIPGGGKGPLVSALGQTGTSSGQGKAQWSGHKRPAHYSSEWDIPDRGQRNSFWTARSSSPALHASLPAHLPGVLSKWDRHNKDRDRIFKNSFMVLSPCCTFHDGGFFCTFVRK